jgi:hypothetical protein
MCFHISHAHKEKNICSRSTMSHLDTNILFIFFYIGKFENNFWCLHCLHEKTCRSSCICVDTLKNLNTSTVSKNMSTLDPTPKTRGNRVDCSKSRNCSDSINRRYWSGADFFFSLFRFFPSGQDPSVARFGEACDVIASVDGLFYLSFSRFSGFDAAPIFFDDILHHGLAASAGA